MMEFGFLIFQLLIALIFLIFYLLLFVKFPLMVIKSISEEIGNKLVKKSWIIYTVATLIYLFIIYLAYTNKSDIFIDAFLFLVFLIFLTLCLLMFVQFPLFVIKTISEEFGNKLFAKAWIIYLIAIIAYLFWVRWMIIDSNNHPIMFS